MLSRATLVAKLILFQGMGTYCVSSPFFFNFYISKNSLLVPAEAAFLQSGGTKRRLQWPERRWFLPRAVLENVIEEVW